MWSFMIEWILDLPAYMKVGGALAGILLTNRFGLSLGFAILLFSLILSLWSGTGIPGIWHQFVSFKNPENYLLPVVVLFLLFFTESLNQTGRMERTVTALKAWLKSRKMLLAGLPALVGLLPMPAGALFSAPMVASVDKQNELDAPHKAAINYWFRHIWEYWWPLYPGVVLAITYSGLSAAFFYLIQIPFTLVAAAAGYFFILKKIKRNGSNDMGVGFLDRDAVLSALGPIGLLVILSVIGSTFLISLEVSGSLSSLIAMLAGLILAIVMTFFGHTTAWASSLVFFKKSNTWLMIVLVIGIQMFSVVLKSPVDSAGTTLVTLMRDEFIRIGIPILAVIMLIPFISGMVTGTAFGFVGASFPIVFALVGQHPTLRILAATTSCAYAFGYMGMILSPIHSCYVVTCEYFETPVLATYRYIAGPCVLILLASLILSGLYYTLM
jgi:integral membrane protein (TIGR00529 family)